MTQTLFQTNDMLTILQTQQELPPRQTSIIYHDFKSLRACKTFNALSKAQKFIYTDESFEHFKET